jgi:hypothetical protein
MKLFVPVSVKMQDEKAKNTGKVVRKTSEYLSIG